MLLVESGVRIHLSEFDWPKNPMPSGFSVKVRICCCSAFRCLLLNIFRSMMHVLMYRIAIVRSFSKFCFILILYITEELRSVVHW